MKYSQKLRKFEGEALSRKYKEIYEKSIVNKESFWKEVSENIFWYKKPSKILNSDNPPFYKWFEDGVTNTCYNALDLHIDNGKGEKLAIIYDSPITGTKKNITYNELREKISFEHKNLKILGFLKHKEVLKIFNKTSIAVACSRWEEPFGRTSLEASSRGCSVIISNRGGLPETITNGVILKKLNYIELYKSIEQLIKNKKKRQELQKLSLNNFYLTHKFFESIRYGFFMFILSYFLLN